MLEKCQPADLHDIYTIINDAASAYKGVIPADRWHDPYLPLEELTRQIEEGVVFKRPWCLPMLTGNKQL